MSTELSTLAAAEIRALEPYRPGFDSARLGARGAVPLINLAANENPLGCGSAARRALADAGELSRYPDGNGTELKAALAERLGVVPEQLTLGAGSNEVLLLIAQTLVRPGLEVMYSRYSFIVYRSIARITGGTPVEVPDRARGHDPAALAAAITPRTRLMYIANPNNPTGTWLTATALRRLLESLPEHVVAVLDEAYCEYMQGRSGYPDCVSWLVDFPRLVVTRTFSKLHGLAGLRIGYAVSHPELAELMNRVRQPFNVNRPALAAARAALGDHAHIERSLEVNRNGILQWQAALERNGIDGVCGGGNFVFLDLARPAAPVSEALLADGVVVRPLGEYGLPNGLRVTIGRKAENVRCIEALEHALGRLPAAAG